MASRMGIPKYSARMGAEQHAPANPRQRAQQAGEESEHHQKNRHHGSPLPLPISSMEILSL